MLRHINSNTLRLTPSDSGMSETEDRPLPVPDPSAVLMLNIDI